MCAAARSPARPTERELVPKPVSKPERVTWTCTSLQHRTRARTSRSMPSSSESPAQQRRNARVLPPSSKNPCHRAGRYSCAESDAGSLSGCRAAKAHRRDSRYDGQGTRDRSDGSGPQEERGYAGQEYDRGCVAICASLPSRHCREHTPNAVPSSAPVRIACGPRAARSSESPEPERKQGDSERRDHDAPQHPSEYHRLR